MTRNQQFNVSIRQYQGMHPGDLELFSSHLLPGMQFRFATFENNDYREGNVTCYLYNYVPDSVFFSVETPLEIESALEKIMVLNPGVEWYWATLNYKDHEESGHSRVVIELRLSNIPMRVSASGKLICK